ncbi:MAG: HAD family hydrolase [Proteobacteria bacterium]|nr:HAD family hydrolase [Pseudomonadota bacterium]
MATARASHIMPKLQGLIFDLDGTLIDSAPDLRQALNLMLAAAGRRPLSLAETKEFVGDGALALVQRSFAATGQPLPDSAVMTAVKQFLGFYRTITPDPVQLYPHVQETLDFYHQAGVKLGLCTNKPQAETDYLLQGLKLMHYFAFVAGCDTFQYHKPNPEHVTGTIIGMDVSRTGCVMVGDSKNDILAAKGAKIPAILINHGYGKSDGLRADRTISSLTELPAALLSLGFAPVL